MTSYVIKHEPSNTFIAVSDEIGPFRVPLQNAHLFLLENALECVNVETGFTYLDDIEIDTTDLCVYEVEITLKNKI